jgi:hypothetical protein
VDVTLAKTGRPLGTFDLRFPQALQMFELVWNVTDATAAQREGVALRLRAKGPAIWCFSPSSEADASPREFQPHLLHTTGLVDAKAEYFRRLASLASIVPFGWMEGCVLDGLRDLAAGKPNSPFEKARREHWAMYLDHESRLAYAAASRPLLDQFETIEATLPIADLVLWRPRHRVVDLALGYLASAKKRVASASVQDFELVGCHDGSEPCRHHRRPSRRIPCHRDWRPCRSASGTGGRDATGASGSRRNCGRPRPSRRGSTG